MTEPLSRRRRLLCAAAALTLSAWIFRPQLAQSLVVRGDDYLYTAHDAQALERYRRAIALDPGSQIAADRFIFIAMTMHQRASVKSGIATASAFLKHSPDNSVILKDRALCYLIERHFEDAQHDFERAARLSSDPTVYDFAGWSARRAGDLAGARSLWNAALKLSPHNVPALRGLRSLPQ